MESIVALALLCSTAARRVHVPAAVRQILSCRLASGRSRVSSTEKVAAYPTSSGQSHSARTTETNVGRQVKRVAVRGTCGIECRLIGIDIAFISYAPQ